MSNENEVFKVLPLCLHILGIEPQLRINPPVGVANLLSRMQETKLCRTTKSEGYDTISRHSSEIVSEVKHFLYLPTLSRLILGH